MTVTEIHPPDTLYPEPSDEICPDEGGSRRTHRETAEIDKSWIPCRAEDSEIESTAPLSDDSSDDRIEYIVRTFLYGGIRAESISGESIRSTSYIRSIILTFTRP